MVKRIKKYSLEDVLEEIGHDFLQTEIMDKATYTKILDPTTNDYEAAILISKIRVNPLMSLFFGDPRFNPAAKRNQIFINCCEFSPSNALEFLSDPRVNPSAKNNAAFRRGKNDIRHVIAADPRFDVSLDNYSLLHFIIIENLSFSILDFDVPQSFMSSAGGKSLVDTALNHGSFHVVEKLVIDQRVDLTLDNYSVTRKLLEVEYRQMVFIEIQILDFLFYGVNYSLDFDLNLLMEFLKSCRTDDAHSLSSLLAQNPKFNLEAENSILLSMVVCSNSVNCARILFPLVDLSWNDNWAIRLASREGYTELVYLLLNYPQVDPSAYDSEALYTARAEEFDEIREMIDRHGRAKMNLCEVCYLLMR